MTNHEPEGGQGVRDGEKERNEKAEMQKTDGRRASAEERENER